MALAPAACLTAEAAAARVDASQEGAGPRGRKLALLGVANLEEHPVAAAVLALRLDRPISLVRPPRHLGRRRLLCEDAGCGTLSAEDGAHRACLVPTRPEGLTTRLARG